ncbi:bacteriocin-protection protein, YdeI/OmpD-associated family [Cytophagaceae bacterium 50C-KIRBA]|uniref:Bacteriocin-protection protein, YdeI/OmpD-associated family n=1 Tax=Aquirufa beregesia TaxID=2516556 RepID=A0ABX0EXL6_9BACT|nr:YdeI/OmpD-associated family protein [Aquirufa beregesia]NGZ44061.1 bacteriocin-protection protein, YdeI/OmpD-associated family [Aquirufa beregesia]
MTSNKAEILTFHSTQDWREWLEKHHANSPTICLQLSKLKAPEQTISYKEALDEALCFGWIDSQKLPMDDHYWLQKFSQRKPKSIWSKINIQHIERLTQAGKMMPAGLQAVHEAKKDGRWEQAYAAQSEMIIPEDFLVELRKNKPAEFFFQSLNRTNLFAIYFRLQSAKKPETRKKRMEQILEKLANGEKFH